MFFIIQLEVFGVNNPDRINFSFSYSPGDYFLFSDASGDDNKKNKITIDNPFKDTKWDWF